MNVLLIYTNRYRYIIPPPIGLAFLVYPLRRQGHQVKVLDLMFSNNPLHDIDTVIDEFKPEIAGFSIRNLDNQYMLDLKNPLVEIKTFIDSMKSAGVVTVLGGTAYTTFPRQMLHFMEADYGIAGQGEYSFPALIHALEKKESIDNIPGLVYRTIDSIKMNKPMITGYAGGQKADWSLFDLQSYKRNAMITPGGVVIVKTGCPYKCGACDVKTTMGEIYIFRNHEEIIDEIRFLRNTYNLRHFFLIDPCFNSPLDKAKDLLGKMIKEKLHIRFVLRCNPVHGSFDNEFFALFARAGGHTINSAIDSFSDSMLENYQKPFRKEDIALFSQMAHRHGIRLVAEMLFGGPGETNETIKESMAFLPYVQYAMLQYSIGIRINPLTSVYDTAIKEGIIKGEDELLFSKFYVSKDVDIEWAKKFIRSSVRRYAYRILKMPPVILRNMVDALL
jgi:radical SAM superfamily enzyme YgiQ (UPF0313 family)